MSEEKPLVFREHALQSLEESNSTKVSLFLESPNEIWIVIFVVVSLLVFILWMCFGRISFKEIGQGVLINQSGFLINAIANEEGFIKKLHVLPGNVVKKNQLLLTLINPNLKNEFEFQKLQLNALIQESQLLNNQYNNEKILQQRITDIQLKAYKDITSFQKTNLKLLSKNVSIREHVTQLGFMPKIQFEKQLRDYHDLIKEFMENNAQMVQVEKNQINLENMWRQKLLINNTHIFLKKIEVQNIREKLARTTNITSPIDGTITDILISLGAQVRPGQSIITISPLITDLGVLLLIPAQRGQNIKPGMKAIIEPAGIDIQIYGGLKAKISHVYYYPISRRSLISILQNEDTVNSFFEHDKNLFLVRLSLERNKHSRNGYTWTSKKGEIQELHAGNLCKGNISVKTERPASLLIPGLKKIIGVKD